MTTLAAFRRTLPRVFAFVLAALPAAAHDFWIEPANFRPAPDARIGVELRVGERLVGDPVPRKAERIARFTCTTRAGVTDVAGIEDQSPAGLLRCTTTGLAWLAYESRPIGIELEAAKFEAYLAEEGLEHVIAARKERGESALPGRERYRRSAKALLAVGEGDRAGFDRVLGLPLELVPAVDPSALRSGAALDLVVLYEGKPLANALVGCRARADVEHETRLRSDAAGRVRFAIAHGGEHLVRVVHMTREPKESGADWLSTWGALGFDVLPALAPKPAPPKPGADGPPVRTASPATDGAGPRAEERAPARQLVEDPRLAGLLAAAATDER
ncbi:MAG: DUF4198 domain-containing protein [Planctomycetes bacterium]|nr:DUF4198 domain-containing protein [Planctomycetota bacterium]